MKKLITYTCAIAALAIPTMGVAQQQKPMCGPTEEVHKHNMKQGHELKVIALDFQGNLIEIWQDGDEDYGILVTSPTTGQTCYINGGTMLEINPAQPEMPANL